MPDARPTSAAPDPLSVGGEIWTLHVSLGAHRPRQGARYRAMVYLHAPGPRPAPRTRTWDASGLPLWFLTRAGGPLRELRSPGEEVPPDRRHLKGWARAVRPLEVNVEVSDLGTVLQARYRVPTGVWLHVVMEGRAGADGPPERLRTDRLFAVGGGEDPGPLELHAGPARYHVRLERNSEKGA